MKNTLSAVKIFWIIIISIMLVETTLMTILHYAGIGHMSADTHKMIVFIDGILLCFILTPLLFKFVYKPMKRTVEDLENTRLELRSTIHELAVTLTEVKQLRGIIPICTTCKNIRDDKGLWKQVEEYMMEHSEADFSHSICPDCAKSFYEELEKYDKVDQK